MSGCFSAFASGMDDSTFAIFPNSSCAISVSGFAGGAMHFDFNGPLKLWCVTLEALAQSPVQFRVAGLP